MEKTLSKNSSSHPIIHRPSFTIMGISCKTSNDPTKGPFDISKLWERFFTEGIFEKIEGKLSNDIFALYCDYEGDYTKPYTVVIGCAVSESKRIPSDMIVKKVPDSSYTLFQAIGDHPETLIQTWQKIWKEPLERTYTGDFEVYGSAFSSKPPQVDVYIAITPQKDKVL